MGGGRGGRTKKTPGRMGRLKAPKEFMYKDTTILFYPKGGSDGWFFVHKVSGHGMWATFSSLFNDTYGKPALNNAEEVFAHWVEDNATRIEILNQYKKYYPE